LNDNATDALSEKNKTRKFIVKNASSQQRILLGGFILIIGVLSLLDNLNIFNTRDILQFWPMVFIALGSLKISQSGNRSGYLIGAALVTAGVLMTLHNLGWIHFRMREWWPMFLILGGILVIFKDRSIQNNSDVSSVFGSDSKIDVVAIMSGNQGKNTSQNFLGGDITAVMGGVDLDFRGASIQTEAVLNVWATWGGIVVKIPDDWAVINNAVALMGGIDDKTVPPMNPTKRLVITGYAIMGGVEIKN
jgi:hypothetical protein